MLTGFCAALFFSTTFILNRAMSLEGGHWFWSASLRYLYMFIFLVLGLSVACRGQLQALFREYMHHWKFWTLSGSVGFGGFYALLCLAAEHTPGWVVATTWQLTILASLVVLRGFGKTFSAKVWGYSLAVFFGVALVNLSQAENMQWQTILMGTLPVLGAAFCYPLGNQLVWEAQNRNPRLPKVDQEVLRSGFRKVLLLTTGSMPFWLLLYCLIRPPLPSTEQAAGVALVALFSGIIATTLFLNARHMAHNAGQLAAADATQASEVLFALVGEILFLGAPTPGVTGLLGILITIAGLVAYVRHDQ